MDGAQRRTQVNKSVEYSELTISEAMELLKLMRSKDVLQGVGKETVDPKLPGWIVSVSLREVADVTLGAGNPPPAR